MTSIDITDWAPAKVEGYLTAIRGDNTDNTDSTAVEFSLIVHTNGEHQMVMALTDDPASDCVARQCQACHAVTVAKILPLPDLPELKAPKRLGVPNKTQDETKRTHDHHDRRNGNGTGN